MTHPLIETEAALLSTFEGQQAAYLKDTYPSYETRQAQLQALKRALQDNQDTIADAINKDFGRRSLNESKLIDVMGCVMDINHSLKHMRDWMKTSRRKTELLFKGNSASVQYQPKGVVGIIVPWNFPVYLAVAPLAAALAAGNRAMIKMSESTPETTQLLAEIIASVFSPSQVAVVGGEVDMAQYFSNMPWNHLVYTGSTNVGRLVMQAAAKNLTPVTLELGGKSPAIVSRQVNLADAARKLAHGKTTNGGQICIAPDYALLHASQVEEFIGHVDKAYSAMYANGLDKTDVVNDRQYQRLQSVIEDAREKGADVRVLGQQQADGRYIPLTVVNKTSAEMRVLQEELFGPILPIVTYETLADAIGYINKGDRPLALYFFGDNDEEQAEVLKRTHSGGVTINDWGWHAFNHDIPFGGIGASGMGKYHGKEGFLELSNARSVLKLTKGFPIQLFHPPYGLIHKKVFRMFLGEPRK